MRVDQTATATPSVTVLTPARPTKEETRTQAAPARPETVSSTPVAGLRVSISDAARQAATASGAGSDATVEASAETSGQTISLIDGIPWPVGVGPAAWQASQGASAASKLVTPEVSEQDQTQSRSPSTADVPAQAAPQAEDAQARANEQPKAEASQRPRQAPQFSAEDATRLAERRKASSVYASEAQPSSSSALNVQV